MKKVFQTIVDKDFGNCMQAAVASILDKELHEVPNFLENQIKLKNGEIIDEELTHSIIYFWNNGYPEASCYMQDIRRGKDKYTLKEIAKMDGGINGYFYASVPSQTFTALSHAVIVDTDLNVIHDPNPNQLALNCKPEDVNYIFTVNDWHLDVEGNLVKGENYVNKEV